MIDSREASRNLALLRSKKMPAITGKSLFLSRSQVDDDPSVVLQNTNSLLSIVGISAKKVTSIGELTRVASSMFVAIFESLFHVRMDHIIRNPQTREEYGHNAQRVIDSLSERIQMDLQHITGELIVRGDIGALSNLVHIFIRIVSMTNQESREFSGMDIYLKGKKETRRNKLSDDLGDSISTHESTFEQFHLSPDFRTDCFGTTNEFADEFLRMSMTDNIMHNIRGGVGEFLKSSRIRFQQEAKLDAARKRRVQHLKVKENRSKQANQRRSNTSIKALQTKWIDETRRGEKAHQLRQQNEEHVMLRKMYRGLLKKMHEWKADENKEVRRKDNETRDEARWHLDSLQSLYDDRLQMLRDQIARKDLSVVKAQRQMVHELRKSFKDQQKAALMDLKEVVEHKRQHELMRRREAQKNLLALVSVEKWDQMLRSYDHDHKSDKMMNFRPRMRSRSAPPFIGHRSSIFGFPGLGQQNRQQNITIEFAKMPPLESDSNSTSKSSSSSSSSSDSSSSSSSSSSSPATSLSAIGEKDFLIDRL